MTKKKEFFSIFVLIVLFFITVNWTIVSGLLAETMKAVSPVIIGLGLAYITNIVMEFYERHYFPGSAKPIVKKSRRAVCLILALLSLIAVIALVIALVVPKFVECVKILITKIPSVVNDLLYNEKLIKLLPESIYDKMLETVLNFNIADYYPKLREFLKNGIGNGSGIMGGLSSTFSKIATAVIGIVFSIYMLATKDMLKRHTHLLARKYIPFNVRKTVYGFIRVLDGSFHSYIVAQCTEAVILGSLCAVGMLILRLPYALMVGAFIAFTALIPIVGGWIGAVVGMVMVFSQDAKNALIFLVFFIVLQQIENKLIYPKVVGTSVGLPGVYVFTAVTVGGTLFGVLGMLMAVPLTAAIYSVLKKDVHSSGHTILPIKAK